MLHTWQFAELLSLLVSHDVSFSDTVYPTLHGVKLESYAHFHGPSQAASPCSVGKLIADKQDLTTICVSCRDVLTSMTVALGTSNSKFSAALNSKGDISVSGTVKGGAPFLTSIGNFDVDLVIEVGWSYCIPACHELAGC